MPLISELFRLIDEIVHAEARGPSRKLYLEAKGLELLALIVAELERHGRPQKSRTSSISTLGATGFWIILRTPSTPRSLIIAETTTIGKATKR